MSGSVSPSRPISVGPLTLCGHGIVLSIPSASLRFCILVRLDTGKNFTTYKTFYSQSIYKLSHLASPCMHTHDILGKFHNGFRVWEIKSWDPFWRNLLASGVLKEILRFFRYLLLFICKKNIQSNEECCAEWKVTVKLNMAIFCGMSWQYWRINWGWHNRK